MDTWNRLIDQRGEGVRGNWKRRAKEHICIYKPMDTDNDVVKGGGLREGEKKRE